MFIYGDMYPVNNKNSNSLEIGHFKRCDTKTYTLYKNTLNVLSSKELVNDEEVIIQEAIVSLS